MNYFLMTMFENAEQTNLGNAMGWLMVYAPAAIFVVMVLIWANRRNRAFRVRLERIEEKIDRLLESLKK
jgi:Na+-transporting NADH:ubiquinone oxidoreductase subunit NqrD